MFAEPQLNAIFANFPIANSWLFVPVLICVFSLFVLRREANFMRVVASLLFAASAWLFCYAMPLFWILRDGLGPASMQSHGDVAIARFMEQFVPLVAMCATISGLGVLLLIVAWMFNKRRAV